MRPRTSLGETPALRQSIGMTALLIYVLATGWARQANRRSAASPVLRSVMGGCAGRTASHASMAWPSKGSTGLVNAAPVWGSPDRTGTDSLQADKAGTSGGCQGGQGCRAAPESPETVVVEFAVAGPEVIAGEIDVAPAQGREMGQVGLGGGEREQRLQLRLGEHAAAWHSDCPS